MLPVVMGGIAVASALGNLFSNASAADQRSDALAKYRKKLIETQYDPVEKAKAIDRVGDTYNTNMVEAMNTSAFGLGRYSNSNTAKAVSMSRMIGQRSGAMVDEANRIEGFNKKIDLDIAGLELQQPITDPLGDLIEGGSAGLQLGMSIGNYESELDMNKEMSGMLKRYNLKNKIKFSPNLNMGQGYEKL
jgi:Tfp pilus assembly protein PilV